MNNIEIFSQTLAICCIDDDDDSDDTMMMVRTGKNNFLPGSTTWRQKCPADQRIFFVLNLHVHKYIVF